MEQLPQEHAPGRRIVTVAGDIGSGKTEICRQLSKATGWEVVSAGAILRKMALEHGMGVLEFNEYAKLHTGIDRDIDAYIASRANHPDSVIVDSRLAWHFLPNSLKVFLVVEPTIAAQRVFRATRPDESHASIETAGSDNAERQRMERQRFMQLYGLDCDYWRNYDLVIDTSYAQPGEAAEVLLRRLQSGESPAARTECWLAPKRLVPTQRAGQEDCPAIDVAVYRGAYLILDGHARASAALSSGRNLIACNLIAFESEPLPGNIALEEFAPTSTSLSRIHDWEAVHGFEFRTYPPWL